MPSLTVLYLYTINVRLYGVLKLELHHAVASMANTYPIRLNLPVPAKLR